jgi:hypothetical protein
MRTDFRGAVDGYPNAGEAKAAGLGVWRTQSCGAPSDRPT